MDNSIYVLTEASGSVSYAVGIYHTFEEAKKGMLNIAEYFIHRPITIDEFPDAFKTYFEEENILVYKGLNKFIIHNTYAYKSDNNNIPLFLRIEKLNGFSDEKKE